jgi:protein involved in polysaccharide export with SLBB domain
VGYGHAATNDPKSRRFVTLYNIVILFLTPGIGIRLANPARAQTPAVAVAPPTAGTYVLGPNDRIRLKVYGEPDIAGEYEIDSNGQVISALQV